MEIHTIIATFSMKVLYIAIIIFQFVMEILIF